MSNPGERSSEQKIEDLLTVLGRIEEIVKTNDKSSEETTKFKITLNSHLNQLTGKVNEFFNDINHSAEQRLITTIKAIEYLNEILVYIPRKGDLYLTWLNYASMANFVRSNMAFIHHGSDIGKSLSNAGTLSQLLLGEIQHIEEIPEMPNYSDPTQYFEYWIPLFNAIQSTFGVYHILIDTLAVINYQDFVTWTNHAIWHYKMLKDLCATTDIRALLSTKKIKNVKNFYNNMLNAGVSVASSSYILATVFEKLQNFPDEIDDLGFLPSRDIEGMIKHLDGVLAFMDSIVLDIQYAYNNFLVNRNDTLESADYYTNFKIVGSDVRLTIELLKFDNDEMVDDLNQIDIILSNYSEMLQNTVQEAGDIDAAIESYLLSSVIALLKNVLPFIAAKAIVLEDTAVLENFLYEYRKAIRVADIDEYAEFHFVKILSILHVYTRLAPDKLELVDHFQELNLAKESFALKPRLYIGANLLLMQFVELGINIADISLFEHNIMETVQQNYTFSRYAQDIELYLLYLKDRVNIDISALRYRKIHGAFDIWTWLYPDWSSISNLEYIPFSTLKDTVV